MSAISRLSVLAPLAVLALLGLAACDGGIHRFVATANETVLVVVEDVKQDGDHKTAKVGFYFARPQPFEDADQNQSTQLVSKTQFDCAAQHTRPLEMTITLQSAGVITRRSPEAPWEQPTPKSLGETVFKVVCDPAAAKQARTLRPLISIVKDYRRRVGGSAKLMEEGA